MNNLLIPFVLGLDERGDFILDILKAARCLIEFTTAILVIAKLFRKFLMLFPELFNLLCGDVDQALELFFRCRDAKTALFVYFICHILLDMLEQFQVTFYAADWEIEDFLVPFRLLSLTLGDCVGAACNLRLEIVIFRAAFLDLISLFFQGINLVVIETYLLFRQTAHSLIIGLGNHLPSSFFDIHL